MAPHHEGLLRRLLHLPDLGPEARARLEGLFPLRRPALGTPAPSERETDYGVLPSLVVRLDAPDLSAQVLADYLRDRRHYPLTLLVAASPRWATDPAVRARLLQNTAQRFDPPAIARILAMLARQTPESSVGDLVAAVLTAEAATGADALLPHLVLGLTAAQLRALPADQWPRWLATGSRELRLAVLARLGDRAVPPARGRAPGGRPPGVGP